MTHAQDLLDLATRCPDDDRLTLLAAAEYIGEVERERDELRRVNAGAHTLLHEWQVRVSILRSRNVKIAPSVVWSRINPIVWLLMNRLLPDDASPTECAMLAADAERAP